MEPLDNNLICPMNNWQGSSECPLGSSFTINKHKYNAVRKIGEGVQGKVYKVFDSHTQKEFAIKVVEKSRYEEINKLIDEELQIVKKLSIIGCSCIIQLIDYETTKQHNLLLMELGDCSLSSYIENHQTTLDFQDTLKLIRNICTALKVVHHDNIIHRDIKPQNIIMMGNDKRNTFKLTDFGVSAKEHHNRQTYIGTEPYMAPEVLESRDKVSHYTKVADIWSLAVVVFEAYFGFNPFSFGLKRVEEQVRLIDEVANNGFDFNKFVSVLDERGQNGLAQTVRQKYGKTPREILHFLVRGLTKDPCQRASIEEIEKIVGKGEFSMMQAVWRPHESTMTARNPQKPPQHYQPSTEKNITSINKQGITKSTFTPNIMSTNYEGSNKFQKQIVEDSNMQSSWVGRNQEDVASQIDTNTTVGDQTSLQSKMMTPIYKPNTQRQTVNKAFVNTVAPSSNNIPKTNMNVNKTVDMQPVKNLQNEKSKFVEELKTKLYSLYNAIHSMKTVKTNTQLYVDLPQLTKHLKVAIQAMESNQYQNNKALNASMEEIYHRVHRLLECHHEYLQKSGMNEKFMYQLLYQLIVMANIDTLLNHTAQAVKGMPLNISQMGFNPVGFLKFECDKENLKQFEWRFLASV